MVMVHSLCSQLVFDPVPANRLQRHRFKAPKGFAYKLLGLQWSSNHHTPEPNQTLTHWKLFPRWLTAAIPGGASFFPFAEKEEFIAIFATYAERAINSTDAGWGGNVNHGVIPLYGFITKRIQFQHDLRSQPADPIHEGYVVVFYNLVRISRMQAILEWLKSQ